jgi:hypothetical protein
MTMHIHPAASWMTPDAFVTGGAIDQRTTHLVRAHGARCLTMWRESLQSFASGQPLTSSLIERHNRQSLDHWAFARAAALVQADGRQLLGKTRGAEATKGAPATASRPKASPMGTLAAARAKLLRGSR